LVQVVVSVGTLAAAAVGGLWVWARHRAMGPMPEWPDDPRAFTVRPEPKRPLASHSGTREQAARVPRW
jgi:hypothetical protein